MTDLTAEQFGMKSDSDCGYPEANHWSQLTSIATILARQPTSQTKRLASFFPYKTQISIIDSLLQCLLSLGAISTAQSAEHFPEGEISNIFASKNYLLNVSIEPNKFK